MTTNNLFSFKTLGIVLLTFVFAFYGTRALTKTRTTITQKEVPVIDVVSKNVTITSQPVKTVKTDIANVVLFDVPVDSVSVDETLGILNSMDKNAEIYLVLHSPGGSVIDGARLINYIKYSGRKIYTVCDNLCASMAFQIFQVGKKRYMVDKAILMAHPASGGTAGTVENMYELVSMIKKYVDRMDAETAARAGIKYQDFKFMVANNIWVETQDALKLNLADEMIFLDVGFDPSLLAQNSVKQTLKAKGLLTQKLLQQRGYVFNVN